MVDYCTMKRLSHCKMYFKNVTPIQRTVFSDPNIKSTINVTHIIRCMFVWSMSRMREYLYQQSISCRSLPLFNSKQSLSPTPQVQVRYPSLWNEMRKRSLWSFSTEFAESYGERFFCEVLHTQSVPQSRNQGVKGFSITEGEARKKKCSH